MREAIAAAAVAPPQLTGLSGEQSFCFSSDFVGFAGHFPDYPILPAVLQVLLAQLVAEAIVGRPLQVVSLSRAKFVRQLRPAEKIDVVLDCREQGADLRCSVTLQVGDEKAASFTLTLKRDLVP
jgi:3-hydroxyacyl-[acyl-carrier-protein] dehydratase